MLNMEEADTKTMLNILLVVKFHRINFAPVVSSDIIPGPIFVCAMQVF